MRTYKEEHAELVAWMKKRNEEYDKAGLARLKENNFVLDGEETYQHQLDIQEYNRRLTELHKKYNIPDKHKI